MRFASMKTLKEWFPKVEEKDLLQIRNLVKGSGMYMADMERVLEQVDKILDGHGVEAIFPEDSYKPAALYVNMGDTYTPTILLDCKTRTFRACCWGDWLEKNEGRNLQYW